MTMNRLWKLLKALLLIDIHVTFDSWRSNSRVNIESRVQSLVHSRVQSPGCVLLPSGSVMLA